MSARNEVLNATVRHDAWAGNGFGKITIFEVALRNLGRNALTITTDNFSLTDADGRQYAAITPQEAALTSSRLNCRPRWGIGSGWGWGWNDTFSGSSYYYEDELYCDPAASELLSESLLPMGPLKPGAKVRGLVFFRGKVEDPAKVTLELDVPGYEPLRFPFVGVDN